MVKTTRADITFLAVKFFLERGYAQATVTTIFIVVPTIT